MLWDKDKSSRREVGGTFKREGTYVYLWLIHTDVWQKPTQHCKAIFLQFKTKILIHSPGPKVLTLKHILTFLFPFETEPVFLPAPYIIIPPHSAHQGRGCHPATLAEPYPVCSDTFGLVRLLYSPPLSTRTCLQPVGSCLSGGPLLDG